MSSALNHGKILGYNLKSNINQGILYSLITYRIFAVVWSVFDRSMGRRGVET